MKINQIYDTCQYIILNCFILLLLYKGGNQSQSQSQDGSNNNNSPQIAKAEAKTYEAANIEGMIK